jgi:ketosteroid isomerase-like protein
MFRASSRPKGMTESDLRTREECSELLRRGYEAWNSGRVSEVVELIHPDFQCDAPAGTLAPPGVRGPRRFERIMRELSRDWDEFRCQLDELRYAGELLVALVLEEGRDRSTGEWVRRETFHIWTIRDNKAVRFGRHPRASKIAAA